MTKKKVQFRNLGGTIGLAQQSAVLESHIRTYLRHLVTTGKLDTSDASLIYASLSSLSSSTTSGSSGLDALPPQLKEVVATAYKNGTADAFMSLLPWCLLAFGLCLVLKNITEPVVEENEGMQLQVLPAESQRDLRSSGGSNPVESLRSIGSLGMPSLGDRIGIRV